MGDLVVLDTRGKEKKNLFEDQIFDREVTWTQAGWCCRGCEVGVVRVKVGKVELEMVTMIGLSRHLKMLLITLLGPKKVTLP